MLCRQGKGRESADSLYGLDYYTEHEHCCPIHRPRFFHRQEIPLHKKPEARARSREGDDEKREMRKKTPGYSTHSARDGKVPGGEKKVKRGKSAYGSEELFPSIVILAGLDPLHPFHPQKLFIRFPSFRIRNCNLKSKKGESPFFYN